MLFLDDDCKSFAKIVLDQGLSTQKAGSDLEQTDRAELIDEKSASEIFGFEVRGKGSCKVLGRSSSNKIPAQRQSRKVA